MWVLGNVLLSGRISVRGSGETVPEDFKWYHPATVLTLSSVSVLLVTVQCVPCCRIHSHHSYSS